MALITEDDEGAALPESGDQMLFQAFNLRVVGLLWCSGDPLKKAVELYDNMQDANQPKIAATDKDFEENFDHMFDLASEMVVQNDIKFGKNKGKKPAFALMDDEDKNEKYGEIREEFLDQVFGYQS